jgi:G:T-mismatch repair DNA endonuclease (very short patch repair protein)
MKKIEEIDKLGWRVAVIWQCSLDSVIDDTLRRLAVWIKKGDNKSRIAEF